INKGLPPRYRSCTLTSTFVVGERRFRIASEMAEPEWGERADLDLSYWGLVHQSTFTSDLTRLQERQRRAATEAPWSLDPVELVKKRFADARDVRVGSKHAGLAGRLLERGGWPADNRAVSARAGDRRREEHLGLRRDPLARGTRVRVPDGGGEGQLALSRQLSTTAVSPSRGLRPGRR